MDLSPSSPDLQNSSPEIVTTDSIMAAAAVANPHMPGPGTTGSPGASNADSANATGSNGKRYRPTPAKTFQCRGYGECRMVFSRSEHLARHIRKHTGERPFSCHCTKQFSRLDNLRQHAQTVHADKQEENERMMRDLTSLHATMSAVNKLGTSRGGRKGKPLAPGGTPVVLLKQEEQQQQQQQQQQRPGTSTGYESGEVMYDYNNTTVTSSRTASNSSFRDQTQSFRESSQSFLGPPNASPRSLPPLAAVVSASLSQPTPSGLYSTSTHQLQQQLHSQSIFQFQPGRPTTAHRPGTAPASASSFFAFADRPALGRPTTGRPDLSLLHSGFGGRPSSSVGEQLYQLYQLGDTGEASSANDASPFYFNPPALNSTTTTGNSPVSNPRKRPFGGPDGPSEDSSQQLRERPGSSAGFFGELNYEYGSESRPQSRRLTVMELCTDDKSPRPASQQQQRHPSGSAFLLSPPATAPYGSTPSRPTTSGLVSSTSMLRLVDQQPTSPGSGGQRQPAAAHVLSRTSPAAAGANGDGTARGGGTSAISRGSSGIPAVPPPPPTSSSSPLPISSSTSTSPAAPLTPPTVLPPTTTTTSDPPYCSDAAFSGNQQRGQPHHPQQQQYHQQQQYQQQQPSYPQHKQQQLAQYQLAHSPAFSSSAASAGTSDASCSGSPRSPVSDGSGSSSSGGSSPFPAYALHHHPPSSASARTSSSTSSSSASSQHSIFASHPYAGSGIPPQSHHHRLQHQHQHQRRDGQVGASAATHPAGLGMRV